MTTPGYIPLLLLVTALAIVMIAHPADSSHCWLIRCDPQTGMIIWPACINHCRREWRNFPDALMQPECELANSPCEAENITCYICRCNPVFIIDPNTTETTTSGYPTTTNPRTTTEENPTTDCKCPTTTEENPTTGSKSPTTFSDYLTTTSVYQTTPGSPQTTPGSPKTTSGNPETTPGSP